ncbi:MULTISPECIES: WXG100 family type VII secretion target [Mycolicibacterium]|jgi:uncharacterized protein YukE|uniref:WXG100 family type VII secretion target n=2 Tax=Mycolicibacterium TaxID=1866885 RepID=A0A378TJW7_9MYCO|nr:MULTISPECIES: hypothetical protein [Mycolicibacterium]MCV7183800.1 hypothetical protein [Mycolicibacterium murale]BBY84639.1 hypothetical protein MTOK_04210 [Mycolicibacterium tokaiense]GFG57734.1 hypothetical protein MMUR_18700 [Mycolicibacterium murale]STZ60854.1 Uncharacterised protein [Mycolicibacterium tokaiense]
MPEFGVRPDELRSTADDLADVSSRMKGVMSRLSLNLAAEGAPWGDDDSGRKFRHGDNNNGYESQRDWVEGSVDVKAQLLDQYSEGLRTGANTLEQTDDI